MKEMCIECVRTGKVPSDCGSVARLGSPNYCHKDFSRRGRRIITRVPVSYLVGGVGDRNVEGLLELYRGGLKYISIES